MRKMDDSNLLCTSLNKRVKQNRYRLAGFDVYADCRSDIITHERIGPFHLPSTSLASITLVARLTTDTTKQQTFRFCIRLQERKNAAS